MTKAELIDKIHEDKGINAAAITKKNVAAIVELTFDLLSASLKAESRFSYPGFGTFNKKERKERTGINPKTKEPLQIPASTTVTFKPASSFKGSLQSTKKAPAAKAAPVKTAPAKKK
jgi:DNA-binding protein HU-beta